MISHAFLTLPSPTSEHTLFSPSSSHVYPTYLHSAAWLTQKCLAAQRKKSIAPNSRYNTKILGVMQEYMHTNIFYTKYFANYIGIKQMWLFLALGKCIFRVKNKQKTVPIFGLNLMDIHLHLCIL